MIYPSGNPADLAEAAENIYPCCAVLKSWSSFDLTKDLREQLVALGNKSDPVISRKRKLLEMLVNSSSQ